MLKVALAGLAAILIGSMSMSAVAGPSHYTASEIQQFNEKAAWQNRNDDF